MTRADGDPPPDVAMWINDLSELSAARDLVAAALPHDEDTRMDAAVVVSELVTNAFEHGTAHAIRVEIRRRADRLHCTVVSPSDEQPDSFEPTPDVPDVTETRGRGLLIVRALTAAYEVEIADGSRHDRVQFDITSNADD